VHADSAMYFRLEAIAERRGPTSSLELEIHKRPFLPRMRRAVFCELWKFAVVACSTLLASAFSLRESDRCCLSLARASLGPSRLCHDLSLASPKVVPEKP